MTSDESESAPSRVSEPAGGSSGGVAAGERPPERPETGDKSDGPGPPPRGEIRSRSGLHGARLIAAVVVGAVVLFGASYFAATRFFRRPEPQAPPAARPPATRSDPQVPANFVTFRDQEAGVGISYPKSWTKFGVKPVDATVRLAAGMRNSEDLLLIRVIPVSTSIDPTTVFSLKKSFDEYLGADKLNIIKEEQITLNGLVGWHYLYTFPDRDSREVGIKSHYLLANGAKIDVLVFQAFPKADFKDLAKTFDRIAGTFRSTPRAAPPPPPSPGG